MPGRYDLNRPHLRPLHYSRGATVGVNVDDNNSILPGRDGYSADSLGAIRYMSLWYYRQAFRQFAAQAIDTVSSSKAGTASMPRVAGIIIANKHIQVSGIQCDSIRVLTRKASGTSYNLWEAGSDSLTYCKAKRMQIDGSSNVWLSNCTIITPQDAISSGVPAQAKNAITGQGGDNWTLPGATGITFTACTIQTYLNANQIGLAIGGNANDVTFSRCTLIGDMNPTAQTPDSLIFLQIRNATNVKINDCRMKVNCYVAGVTQFPASTDSIQAQAIQFRDGAQAISFLSDTLDLGTRNVNATVQITTYPDVSTTRTIRNVSFNSCIIRGDMRVWPKSRIREWHFQNSVLAAKRNPPLSFGKFGNAGDMDSDSLRVDQCTLVSDSLGNGVSPIALDNRLPATVTSMRVTRNVFYRAHTDTTTTGSIIYLGGVANSTRLFQEENLYWSPYESKESAIMVDGWTRGGCLIPYCYVCSAYLEVPPPQCEFIPSVGNSAIEPGGGMGYRGRDQLSKWGTPALTVTLADTTQLGMPECYSRLPAAGLLLAR
jgi:hypothetical protein